VAVWRPDAQAAVRAAARLMARLGAARGAEGVPGVGAALVGAEERLCRAAYRPVPARQPVAALGAALGAPLVGDKTRRYHAPYNPVSDSRNDHPADANSVARLASFLEAVSAARRLFGTKMDLWLSTRAARDRLLYVRDMIAAVTAASQALEGAGQFDLYAAEVAPLAAMVARGNGWLQSMYGDRAPRSAEAAWDRWVARADAEPRELQLFAEVVGSVHNEAFLFAPRQYGYVNANVYGIAGTLYWRRVESGNALVGAAPAGVSALRARVLAKRARSR
jgi:hypothetical protein